MRYYTHISTSLALSLPIMSYTGTLEAGCLAALTLGAIFPDVDEPRSYVGKRAKGISIPAKLLFGHRGAIHSLPGMGIIALVAWIIFSALGWPGILVQYFSLGFFLHLLEDSFSKSGIAWLQPFSKRYYQSGFRKIYYTTGRASENLVFIISVLAIFAIFNYGNLELSQISLFLGS